MQKLAQIVRDLETRRTEIEGELQGLNAALRVLRQIKGGRRLPGMVAKRRLSAAARKRISDAQKARWARLKKKTSK